MQIITSYLLTVTTPKYLEFFGSLTGLSGAALISFGEMSGFFVFFASNLFFMTMAVYNKMIPFFIAQIGFFATSIIGIYRNFL